MRDTGGLESERIPFPSHAFGAVLRHHRILAGLTQEALAERAGLSARAISDLERSVTRAPQPGTLDLLAEALQLSTKERDHFAAAARREKLEVSPGPIVKAPMVPDEPEEPVRLFEGGDLEATQAERPGDLTQVPDDGAPPSLAVQSPPQKPPLPIRKTFWHHSGIRAAILMGLVLLVGVSGVLSSLNLLSRGGPTSPLPARGGIWIDDLRADPHSLIPNTIGNDYSILVDQALYLPLFYADAHGVIHPGAAREVPTVHNGGVNADATVWTFHLRPGLLWSDGQPYDARDVDYTWRFWADPAFGANFVTEGLIRSAIVSADHLSITFYLSHPYASFLLAGWVDGEQAPLPAHHFSTLAPGQIPLSADNLNPTVTSGPFLMQDSQPGDHYTLVRNPRYYLARQGPPYLDQLVFRIGASDAAILQDFQAGAADSTQLLFPFTILAYQRLKSYRIVTPPTSDVFEALYFNFHNTVLSTHQEVREAIARAIDQQALIQGPLQGFALPLCTDHPSAEHPGYQPGAPCPAFGLAAANQLLDDNGWVRGSDEVRTREGQRLEFEYSTTTDTLPWRSAVESLIQQNLLETASSWIFRTIQSPNFLVLS